MSVSDRTVFTVQPEDVESVWEDIRPFFETFERERGTASAEDVKWQAANGLAQIWGMYEDSVIKGVGVTRVHTTPRNRFCHIWIAQGKGGVDALQFVYDAIERWATAVGCTAIQIEGRRGWLRVLPGFKESAVILEKSLTDARHHYEYRHAELRH